MQPRLRIYEVRDWFPPIRAWNHQCRLILDVCTHRPLEYRCLLAIILSRHAEIRRVFKLSL